MCCGAVWVRVYFGGRHLGRFVGRRAVGLEGLGRRHAQRLEQEGRYGGPIPGTGNDGTPPRLLLDLQLTILRRVLSPWAQHAHVCMPARVVYTMPHGNALGCTVSAAISFSCAARRASSLSFGGTAWTHRTWYFGVPSQSTVTSEPLLKTTKTANRELPPPACIAAVFQPLQSGITPVVVLGSPHTCAAFVPVRVAADGDACGGDEKQRGRGNLGGESAAAFWRQRDEVARAELVRPHDELAARGQGLSKWICEAKREKRYLETICDTCKQRSEDAPNAYDVKQRSRRKGERMPG